MTSAIIVSGSANRTDQPSASTSREVRVSRSPVPALSTVPIGSASDCFDEVLAQLGEHLLAEGERHVARVARQHRLGEQEDGDDEDRPCRRATVVVPSATSCDEVADQPRGGQPGDGGQDVQRERERRAAGVAAGESSGVAADGGGVGDRAGSASLVLSSRDDAAVARVVQQLAVACRPRRPGRPRAAPPRRPGRAAAGSRW